MEKGDRLPGIGRKCRCFFFGWCLTCSRKTFKSRITRNPMGPGFHIAQLSKRSLTTTLFRMALVHTVLETVPWDLFCSFSLTSLSHVLSLERRLRVGSLSKRRYVNCIHSRFQQRQKILVNLFVLCCTKNKTEKAIAFGRSFSNFWQHVLVVDS